MEFTFTAELWRWEGNAAWHFVALPTGAADEIADRHDRGAGFGSVRVEVSVGDTTWSTSVFPDRGRGTYLLPVKRLVREREGLDDGDPVAVRLRVLDPESGG